MHSVFVQIGLTKQGHKSIKRIAKRLTTGAPEDFTSFSFGLSSSRERSNKVNVIDKVAKVCFPVAFLIFNGYYFAYFYYF